MEYLYYPSGGSFATKSELDLDKEIDKGFGDVDNHSPDLTLVATHDPEMDTVTVPPNDNSDVEEVILIF